MARWIVLLGVLALACETPSTTPDAGTDAGSDAGPPCATTEEGDARIAAALNADLDPPATELCDSVVWIGARITEVDGCEARLVARVAPRVGDRRSDDIVEIPVECARDDVASTALTGAPTSVFSCDRTGPLEVGGDRYEHLELFAQLFHDSEGALLAYVGGSLGSVTCFVASMPIP